MRRAIFPGSFDPVTLGHLDLIQRASQIVDELVVAVLWNKEKNGLFTIAERVKILEDATKHIPNVKVVEFRGLLAEYTAENHIDLVIRGLRNIQDFEYEQQYSFYNEALSNGRLETIFLLTDPKYTFVSSSGMKEAASFGGDLSFGLPDFVADLVMKKLHSDDDK